MPRRKYVRDNPTDTPADKSVAFDAAVQRYLTSFQDALHRRPTNLQRDLMVAAATAQVRYSQALHDPNIRPNDLEALERIARRAGNAMHASFKVKRELAPSLGHTLLGVRP